MMGRVFADTHFYIAILSRRDTSHEKAKELFSLGTFSEVVTTTGVLLELADGMCGGRERAKCAHFIKELRSALGTKVIPLKEELMGRGLALYDSRPDKEWSLTDCISFVVMADEGLDDALTGDRHFEQAGFKALLK